MFTINIKGKRDQRKIEFVKLEMIFYKPWICSHFKSTTHHRTLFRVESEVPTFRRKRIF